jgi:uncharacterized membrane protein
VTSSARLQWLLPAGLLLLSVVPVVAGAVRLTELAGGAAVTSANARFFAAPVPVVVHIIGATLFSTVGAFQFVPSVRRRWPGWHRGAGRVLVVCGLTTALSGLWMTLFYARPPSDGDLLAIFRIAFGSLMVFSIGRSFVAIRSRDVAQHRAWMLRGYAIGMGAGTQVFTHVPWMLALGAPNELTRALLMFAGWAINLGVAEWIIRRRPRAIRRMPAELLPTPT